MTGLSIHLLPDTENTYTVQSRNTNVVCSTKMSSGNLKGTWETVVPIFREQISITKSTSNENKHKYVALDNAEEWNKFFEMQNSPSTNNTNTKHPKRHIRKDSNGMFRYTAEDENKYNGKFIIGKVADEIRAEMSAVLGSVDANSIILKESKNDDGIIVPAARIVLSGSTKPIDTSSLINGAVCKKYRVGSITYCLPDKNKTRGVRCRFAEDGIRVYEVANGSYEMTLNWFAGEKECRLRILISDDGSGKLLECNGVAEDELKAHKEVKIGRQFDAKFLHEHSFIV